MTERASDPLARALAFLALLVALVALADPCTPPEDPEAPSAGEPAAVYEWSGDSWVKVGDVVVTQLPADLVMTVGIDKPTFAPLVLDPSLYDPDADGATT